MKPTGRWLVVVLLVGFTLVTAGCTLFPGQSGDPTGEAVAPAEGGQPLRCDQTPRSPITFAGLEWQATAGQASEQSCWSAGEQNVAASDDYLFLRFQQLDGIWHGSQITTSGPVQHGIHCFRLVSRVDDLDPNLRIGLSLAGTDGYQAAIEFSRRGDPAAIDNALYVVRSPDGDLYGRPFQIDTDAVSESTHCIDWQQDGVVFWSLVQRADGMLVEWLRDGAPVSPGTDDLSLRIDLSLIAGQDRPLNDSPAELVITRVTYTPACPVPGILILEAPAHGAFTTGNQPIFQWTAAPSADTYLIEGFTEASEPVFKGMTGELAYTPPELLDGIYFWRVQGFATGNGCYLPGPVSAAFQITVDTHEPTFSNPTSSPDPAPGGLFTMTQEITDPGSGVHYDPTTPLFYYRFGEAEIDERLNDGVVVGFWNGTAYEASITLDPARGGQTIYWQVKAGDNAGNVGWSAVNEGGTLSTTVVEAPEPSPTAQPEPLPQGPIPIPQPTGEPVAVACNGTVAINLFEAEAAPIGDGHSYQLVYHVTGADWLEIYGNRLNPADENGVFSGVFQVWGGPGAWTLTAIKRGCEPPAKADLWVPSIAELPPAGTYSGAAGAHNDPIPGVDDDRYFLPIPIYANAGDRFVPVGVDYTCYAVEYYFSDSPLSNEEWLIIPNTLEAVPYDELAVLRSDVTVCPGEIE